MTTLSATVSYDGAPFHGFARQEGLLTVQGCIEDALQVLFRRPVATVCAGRTDAGVHARGQVVSFDVEADELAGRNLDALARSMNALTPPEIGVRRVQQRPEGFSARFDALSREYRYFICSDPVPPLVMRNFCWHAPGALDLQAMNEAASYLLGQHDFKSFCLAASAQGKSTVRELLELSVEPVRVAGDELVCIRVVGTAFLHSMVRTIAGSLMLVGIGARQAAWLDDVVKARDRKAAGQSAPAQGLILWQVEYPAQGE